MPNISENIFGNIRAIDKELALYTKEQGASEEVVLAVALVSFVLSRGDSCVHLRTISEALLWEELESSLRPTLPTDREAWIMVLVQSELVGDGSVPSLFVLRDDRFYLYRYFQYEQTII